MTDIKKPDIEIERKKEVKKVPHTPFFDAVEESEYRLQIAEANSKKLLGKIIEDTVLFDRIQSISQALFQKPITELEAQELAALLVDYSKGSAKTFINTCANARLNKDFHELTPEEQAYILKEYLYDQEELLSKNFFASLLFSQTFEQLNDGQKKLVTKRIRRLSSLAQLNKVFLERKRVRAKTKGNSSVRNDFISSGERFSQAVLEKDDVMAFLIFGVPMSECSKEEQVFIGERLVQDLENNLRIYSHDNFFEQLDLKYIFGKLNEMRKLFYSENNITYAEKYKEGITLADPKVRPKLTDLPIQVGKGAIAKEQTGEGSRNILLFLDGTNSKTAQLLVQLINQGYSQEEACTHLDEMLANQALEKGKEKEVSLFLLEQSIKKNGNIQLEWSSTGDSIALVIVDGKIQYDSASDVSNKEYLGQTSPACISHYSVEVEPGTKVLVISKKVYESINKERLLQIVNDSKDIGTDLANQSEYIQAVITGKDSHGNTLEYLGEKTEFSRIECSSIVDFLDSLTEQIKGKKISLEASHIYAHLASGLEHRLGAQIASAMMKSAASNDIHCIPKLFIDDFNAHGLNCIGRKTEANDRNSPENLNEHGQVFLESIQNYGFYPSTVIWEADQVKNAENSLQELEEKGMTEQREEHVYLKGTSVKLYDTKRKIFSCACLDAMRCAEELKENDYTISILPDFYDGQQEDMKCILEALGYDHSKVINIFFNSNQIYIKKADSIHVIDLTQLRTIKQDFLNSTINIKPPYVSPLRAEGTHISYYAPKSLKASLFGSFPNNIDWK